MIDLQALHRRTDHRLRPASPASSARRCARTSRCSSRPTTSARPSARTRTAAPETRVTTFIAAWIPDLTKTTRPGRSKRTRACTWGPPDEHSPCHERSSRAGARIHPHPEPAPRTQRLRSGQDRLLSLRLSEERLQFNRRHQGVQPPLPSLYFFEQEEAYGESDLAIEGWEQKLRKLKAESRAWEFPFLQCTWVGGGRPLVRKEADRKSCRKYFRYNTVVTNGTIPLPDWPRRRAGTSRSTATRPCTSTSATRRASTSAPYATCASIPT